MRQYAILGVAIAGLAVASLVGWGARPAAPVVARFQSDLRSDEGLTLVKYSGPQIAAMSFGADGAGVEDTGREVTAAYAGRKMTAPPRSFMADFVLGKGVAETGSVTLIANKAGLTDVNQITDGSLHVVFTKDYVRAGCWANGKLDDQRVYYAAPMPLGEGIVHRAGYRVSERGLDLVLPDGKTLLLPGPKYLACSGPYAQFESYFVTGGSVATFKHIEIQT